MRQASGRCSHRSAPWCARSAGRRPSVVHGRSLPTVTGSSPIRWPSAGTGFGRASSGATATPGHSECLLVRLSQRIARQRLLHHQARRRPPSAWRPCLKPLREPQPQPLRRGTACVRMTSHGQEGMRSGAVVRQQSAGGSIRCAATPPPVWSQSGPPLYSPLLVSVALHSHAPQLVEGSSLYLVDDRGGRRQRFRPTPGTGNGGG